MFKPWFISPTYSVNLRHKPSLSSVEWDVSLSNCNLGKDVVGAGTPVLSSMGEAAWEESATGEGTALAKSVAVLPSPRLPLVTR